jgi:hypothetical protein
MSGASSSIPVTDCHPRQSLIPPAFVTLAGPRAPCSHTVQGNEVEEVEDPPFSPNQGDNLLSAATGIIHRDSRARMRAHA